MTCTVSSPTEIARRRLLSQTSSQMTTTATGSWCIRQKANLGKPVLVELMRTGTPCLSIWRRRPQTWQYPSIVGRDVMAKRPRPIHQLTAAQFERMFPDEDACRAYLIARRWPQGVRCPRCSNPAVYDLPSRKWHWQCEK